MTHCARAVAEKGKKTPFRWGQTPLPPAKRNGSVFRRAVQFARPAIFLFLTGLFFIARFFVNGFALFMRFYKGKAAIRV